MHVLESNCTLRRQPHVSDHRPSFDRVLADETSHGTEHARQGVAEAPDSLALVKTHAPAVHMPVCSASPLTKTAE